MQCICKTPETDTREKVHEFFIKKKKKTLTIVFQCFLILNN